MKNDLSVDPESVHKKRGKYSLELDDQDANIKFKGLVYFSVHSCWSCLMGTIRTYTQLDLFQLDCSEI